MKINEAIGELNELIPPLGPEITIVTSEAEVREVSELDALVYGGESINHEGLYGWWKAYSKGIYVLWIDSNIAGAVGIWPIKKTTYNRIIRGEIDEVDLSAHDISRRAAERTYSYWYFADIVLRGEYRKKPEKWALFLLGEAIRQWLREGNLASRIHLCALGFEPEGISFLQKFRFLPAGDNPIRSPQGKPVFQRTVEIEDIQQAIDYLTVLRNGEGKALLISPLGRKKYDVFISYRRKSACVMAQLIQSELENRGLKVCVDVTDFPPGHFEKAIRDIITNTPNFIPILSKGCFNQRGGKKDYFIQEIALAIKTHRKIIPIHMNDFKFPGESVLPRNIRVLLKQQCVPYSHEYSEAMIEKILNCIRS